VTTPTTKQNTTSQLLQEYSSHLKEYKHPDYEKERADFNHPNNPNQDPNIGWKCHINVAPTHVVEVAKFLQDSGYCHKYLSGGEIEDGKTFTIYLGSKHTTEEQIPQIFTTIGHLIDPALDQTEVEFAPRIVGRFVGPRTEFAQYGDRGISYLFEYQKRLTNSHITLNFRKRQRPAQSIEEIQQQINNLKKEAYQASHQRLLEVFGNYYGGGISPHQPDLTLHL